MYMYTYIRVYLGIGRSATSSRASETPDFASGVWRIPQKA